jgi:hypothetical protein
MAHSELKAYSSDEEIEESDEEQIMCVCAPLLAPDAAIEPKEDLPAVVSRRCARTPFTAMSARLVRNRPFHVSDPFFLPLERSEIAQHPKLTPGMRRVDSLELHRLRVPTRAPRRRSRLEPKEPSSPPSSWKIFSILGLSHAVKA